MKQISAIWQIYLFTLCVHIRIFVMTLLVLGSVDFHNEIVQNRFIRISLRRY